MHKLLTRTEFRNDVFKRDNNKCVICFRSDRPLDAHHIIERRLWDDGGFYLWNGATLCDAGNDGCHYKAESTEISVEDLREAIGFNKLQSITIPLPEDMYDDHCYDKWGNVILSNGMRSKGPLFFDTSVQEVIKNKLHLFSNRVKYPRTYHLPWSPGRTKDDRVLKSTNHFHDKQVVVTRKMDGENFTGYRDGMHARSIDGKHHTSRNWAKSFWMQKSYELPEDWRIVCENLYAAHSIHYDNLPGYLLGISIWNERNICLSWKDTEEWFSLLDIPIVTVLYNGLYDEQLIKNLHSDNDNNIHEGYVIRIADSFKYKNFNKSVAKFVRANHVGTSNHWMYEKIISNKLKI